MDRHILEKLLVEKTDEFSNEQKKLGEMFVERESKKVPLTDKEILEQNERCGSLGLEISELRTLLKEFEEG